MDFDDLKKDWQSQDGGARIVVPSEVLLRELRRNERTFHAIIFWRDVRETGVALLLVGFFAWGAAKGAGWTSLVIAAACLWVALFLGVDRWRQKRRSVKRGDSVLACAQAAMAEVEHQIWLLRNVLWWYLGPLGGAILLAWVWPLYWGFSRQVIVPSLGALGVLVLVLVGVYWLNTWVVRQQLIPRKGELQVLLESLRGSGEG